VPVVVSAEVGEQLLRAVEADPDLELTVDVERRTLEAPAIGLSVPFPLDDSIQHRFLEGLDDIGLTLQKADDITLYESSRPDWLPTA
jgi:3-isopropylmalate/(R)-2-methylmalate dehydratase small subunit